MIPTIIGAIIGTVLWVGAAALVYAEGHPGWAIFMLILAALLWWEATD